MIFLKKLFSIFKKNNKAIVYTLKQVFTPTTYAELAYKKRPELETQLSHALSLPGKQIIVYGHSGSGKSTLLRYVLKAHHIPWLLTQCTNDMTSENILLDAFDQLGPFYVDTQTDTFKGTISTEMKADYFVVSSAVKATIEASDSVSQKRILPPQLTAHRLARYFGEICYIWIVEDFHKIAEAEKEKLAQFMKLFMDKANEYPEIKIVVIGAAETGREVLAYDSELSNRVSEICVPLLEPIEISEIIETGTNLLNITFSPSLCNKIVKYSNKLATIAHQLSYNICFCNNIIETLPEHKNIDEQHLNDAMELFVREREDTFKSIFEKITKQKSGKYQNVRLILKAIIELPENKRTHHDILVKIQENEQEYPPSNLSSYLTKLIDEKSEEVLRRIGNNYTFSDPFFEAYIRIMYGSKMNLPISNSIHIAGE